MPYVLWKDNRNGNNDIYGYKIIDNLAGTEFNLTTNTANQINPELHKDHAVWTDDRNGLSEIYARDVTNLSKKEIRLTRNNQNDTHPAIYNDIITYEKQNTTIDDLYYINLSNQILCGDCDDLNETINPGIAENVSMMNDTNTCQNNVDDDCDELIDCLDPSCDDSPPCASFCIPEGPSETICNDLKDNDCDLTTDCDDPDCLLSPDCNGNATLHGYAFDDQKWPIDLATVTGFPPTNQKLYKLKVYINKL
ncbi:MAG TPA: hypothetical protein VJG90_01550 [Candidatus Nanoarchaeia archaeon]|nr:hypothetical protein [Candidatus Nanoarchaeia archaeon]